MQSFKPSRNPALGACKLSSKSIQSATLPLKSVDNVHSGDGLPLGMLCVGDGIADDILQENLENIY